MVHVAIYSAGIAVASDRTGTTGTGIHGFYKPNLWNDRILFAGFATKKDMQAMKREFEDAMKNAREGVGCVQS